MAASQSPDPVPYRPSIYFFELLLIFEPHDCRARDVKLCLPESYTPDDVRALLEHDERQLRQYPTRQFTPLPVWQNTNPEQADRPALKELTLHVDLTADALCLANLEDGETPRRFPRGRRTLPEIIPALRGAHHLAVPWTPFTFVRECERCDTRAPCWSTQDEILVPCRGSRGSKCTADDDPRHRLQPVPSDELFALWPSQFPQLENIFLVVDPLEFPEVSRLRDPLVKPDGAPEVEFRALRRPCYYGDADRDKWEKEAGPDGAAVAARALQRGFLSGFRLGMCRAVGCWK
ncbi:c28daf4a-7e23-41cf-b141-2b877ac81fab [Thermothielavioides terrestris]|uniref:C28daf4a-7e23-41cf-b141-2b877ac81fab n=1 Tax=Thermothielavioides terrestris TaxID=2587410 RepID=A0A3S4AYQ3_9PEZI|nr:c28daf4a-7e23-41cf-b141-2b877ac81fab [Thermothielavioides terrestris]